MSLSLLWQIQQLEEEKRQLEKQAKKLPEFKELKMLKEEIEGGQAESKKLHEDMWSTKRQLLELEDQISSLKGKVSQADAELYSGTTNNVKELEATQKSIDAVMEKLNHEEERALKVMDTLENRQQHLTEVTVGLDQKKDEFRQLNKKYNDRKIELAGRLKAIGRDEEKLSKQIDPGLLEEYYQMCARYDDRKGAALLRNDTCSGCNMTVSFELKKQAKFSSDRLFCDNCGRILIPAETLM